MSVAKIQPQSGATRFTTHVITVPGTRFFAYINAEIANPEEFAKLIHKAGGRRKRPEPVITPIAEWRKP